MAEAVAAGGIAAGIMGAVSTPETRSKVFCECGAEKELHYAKCGEWDCPVCWEAKHEAREAAKREAERLRALRRGVGAKFYDADMRRCDDKIAAVAAVKRWVADPAGIILVHGKCGRGKTYLASAAKKEFNRRDVLSQFICEDEIFLRIKQSFEKNAKKTEYEVYESFAHSYPLIIDDAGVEKTSEFTLSVWERIIGRRYRENYPTMITSNLNIDELAARMGFRITERIRESKMIYEYTGENRRAR
ncbi:MAG: ATP-binding protein [Chitinispirillales bacterium]|jgi:DNA replication protein DnaC|nr:ATP-binding protein [Chitinispirillales bacterium]